MSKTNAEALDKGFDIFIKTELVLCVLSLAFEVFLVIEYQDINSLLLLILGLGFLAGTSMINLMLNFFFVVPYLEKKIELRKIKKRIESQYDESF